VLPWAWNPFSDWISHVPFHQNPPPDIRAAALQYVRKISGFRAPAAHNAEAFNSAVDEIAEATRHLLADLRVGTAARG
jgi:hypothetical protein